MEGYIIAFLVGSIFGLIVTVVRFRFMAAGRLNFYQLEDNEPPVMTAELYKPVEEIHKCKYVLFHISHK